MSSEEEERLESFLLHLRSEFGILERMVYKNKNQHRRCPYFQSLLKVRRDVRLLVSIGLEDILKSAFQVIHGKNPARRVYLLERLKEGSGVKHNFRERLLGVARLLSQMIEPILRAAIQISTLLARSFFVAFSLTILSVLARLRVLLQQMLIDIVSVLNEVSSLSEMKHTVKLIKNGVEAFREYYPPKQKAIMLNCSWEVDKFVLHERIYESGAKELENIGIEHLEAPYIQYETLEVTDGDVLEASGEGTEVEKWQRNDVAYAVACPPSRNAFDTAEGADNASDSIGEDEANIIRKGSSSSQSPPGMDTKVVGFSSSNSQGSGAPGKRREAGAFLTVEATPETIQRKSKKMKLDEPPVPDSFGNDTEDSFFNLLTAGNLNGSLFD